MLREGFRLAYKAERREMKVEEREKEGIKMKYKKKKYGFEIASEIT